MNGKKSKLIRKRARELQLEWINSLMPEGETITKEKLDKALPQDKYYMSNGTTYLSFKNYKWLEHDNDIKKDVNQIKKSLLEIEEILEPIEHIDDPVGLTQHMKFRPMQKEYPEANFLDGSTVSDEPLPIVIETDISTETNQ